MARPRSPEGKRVHVQFRVSEATIARIDAVRGEQTRSQWLHGLVEAALGGQQQEATASRPAGAHAGHQVLYRVGRRFCQDCGDWAG